MKRMNKVKNVSAAKIMGGMVAGLAALAGMAPVTAFAQSQEVTCTCEEKCSEGAVNEDPMWGLPLAVGGPSKKV